MNLKVIGWTACGVGLLFGTGRPLGGAEDGPLPLNQELGVINGAQKMLMNLEQAMEKYRDGLKEKDPARAAQIDGALKLVRASESTGEPILQKMDRIRGNLKAGARGLATEQEKQLLADIESILKTLSEERERPTPEEIKEALWIAEKLYGEQKGHADRGAQPGANRDPGRLAAQAGTHEKTRELEGRLGKLDGKLDGKLGQTVQKAGSAARNQAEAMKAIAEAKPGGEGKPGGEPKPGSGSPGQPQDGKPDGAEQDPSEANRGNGQSPPSKPQAQQPPKWEGGRKEAGGGGQQEQQQAANDLKQVVEDLQAQAQELQNQDEIERLLKIEMALTRIRESEKEVKGRTVKLDEGRKDLLDHQVKGEGIIVAGLQDKTAKDAAQVVGDLEKESVAVYAGALNDAADLMVCAQRRLKVIKTDGYTQKLEQDAIDRLTDLIEALKKDREEKEKKPGKPQPPQPPGPQQKPKLVPDVAQLRMLKRMEQRIGGEVKGIDRSLQEGGMNEALRAEVDRVSGRQDRVARLTRKMAQALEQTQPGNE